MGLVVAPIVDGKVEAWKSWTAEFSGPRKNEFEDLNHRYGLTRHEVWFAQSPGAPLAVVIHEGPGADSFMQKIAQSDNSFDLWMKEHIESYHNMDLSKPPPGPMPERML